jgi:hypothetical protein
LFRRIIHLVYGHSDIVLNTTSICIRGQVNNEQAELTPWESQLFGKKIASRGEIVDSRINLYPKQVSSQRTKP